MKATQRGGLSTQKNVRISPDLDRRLDAAARGLGLKASSALLRGGLELAARDPVAALAAAQGQQAPSSVPASPRASRSHGREAVTGTPEKLTREKPAAATDGPTVDLATWLSGRTGMPRSLVRREVVSGHVRVRGVPCTDLEVPGPLRPGEVEMRGEQV